MLKKNLNKLLPNNLKIQVIFTGQKLSTQFDVKDRTKFKSKQDIIYFGKCPEQNYTDNYLGESARRISARIMDHGGRDQKTYLFTHAIVKEHRSDSYNDFKIIGSGFRNITFKRNVAENMLMKEFRPTLNVPEMSVELKLVN